MTGMEDDVRRNGHEELERGARGSIDSFEFHLIHLDYLMYHR